MGRSHAIKCLLIEAESIARGADRPVLIVGPIGAGKTLLARYIHAHSSRASGPLQIVDCGAVSDLDNILFGHRRGAFTGAATDAKGRLKQADGGIIVLDDVERLSHRHQDQLHRVLVDGTYYPVGGDDAVRVDVRFIATTNQDPYAAAERGTVKRDFLSRLDYFVLRVPGLEGRADDLPDLAMALLRRNLEDLAARGICRQHGLRFASECWEVVRARRFDDHVRGLDKMITRLIVHVGERATITPSDIVAVWPATNGHKGASAPHSLQAVRDEAERDHIVETLKANGWNVARTARELDVTVRCLFSKLKKYGIRRGA